MKILLINSFLVSLCLLIMPGLAWAQNDSLPAQIIFNDADKKAAEDEKERYGPKNLPFEVLQQFKSDYEFNSGKDILNVYKNIYRDGNINAGYYYYIPAEYTLNWTGSDPCSYAFYINFLSGSNGEAVVTAELKPNISRQDLELVQTLLKADLAGKIEENYPITELISMPLAAPPTISFSQIRNFGVNPDDIEVRTPTDFLEPIILSWKMSQVEDLMVALFENVGLNGNLRMTPDGEMPEIEIPINLKLDHHNTFGRLELSKEDWRNRKIKNPTPYPIMLKNLHVMREETKNGKPSLTIYTWEMGNKELPESANAKIKNPGSIPSWIDNDPKVKRMWVEFTVGACSSCNETVRQCLLGGARPFTKNIEVVTLNPLSFTGAQLLVIKMRSFQADPSRGVKKDLKTVTLTSDGANLVAGQLYLKTGEDPNWEYQLKLIMPDGDRYESAWIQTKHTDLYIGESQIKDLFPEFR